MNETLRRWTSRKLWAAAILSTVLFYVGLQDGVLDEGEARIAIAPIITYILVEGGADIATRSRVTKKINNVPAS